MGSLQDEYASYLVSNYCDIAATAFIFYDLIITLGDEIRFFWTRELTGATLLFMLNKWLNILFFSLALVTALRISDAAFSRLPPVTYQSCAAISKTLLVLEGLLYLVWGLFTALRTYALLTANWVLPSMIFLLYAMSVGVNMSQFTPRFGLSGVTLPLLGCVEVASIPVHLVKLFTILSRGSLIIANCLAIGATWFKVYRDHGLGYIGKLGRRTLAGVLLWDGFIYFLVLALIDSLHLTLTLLSLNEFIATDASYLTAFSAPITAILVSRFMLHLQYANMRSTGMASQEPTASNMGSLMFERAFGSLGASITPDDYFPPEGDYVDGVAEDIFPDETVGEGGLLE